ncbi:MAG: HxsD-like protein [Candidatus Woesearchaeota archaeon]
MTKKEKSLAKNLKNNSFQLKFNLKIYSEDSIKQGVEDFKKIAHIHLKKENDSMKAKIIPKKEIKYLDKEFSNYVLGVMMNK